MRRTLGLVFVLAGCRATPVPVPVASPEPTAVDDAPPAASTIAARDPPPESGSSSSDRDGDGILDELDACPNEPENFDGLDDEDGCPDIGCRLPVDGPQAVIVSFEQGHDLRPEAVAGLEDLGRALVQQGATDVEIAGHSDARGGSEDNERLARRRAAAVREVLIGAGLSADVVRVVVHGERQPVAPNDTEPGRRRNRRVEIICVEGC